ncbi:diguanylate cyclase (GGDEF) domain-containing protein [Desulfovibrio sp. 3_1_syn3]|nr:GGDEF domain-containing protein [Desulfovibrio sp. 3_1_syn3]EFL87237.1 diguanylate cyclase (GGDEF) domain-containing protein [Desulfovibrio sp. 3_1_syn3]
MTSTRQRHDTLFRQFIRQLFWPMLFTVGLAMAANILVGYTMAQNEQLNHQRIIETAYAQALLKPLWDCDDKAAQAILDATLQNTIVSGVSLTSACTSSRLHSGTTQDTTQGEETTLVYTDKTGRRFTVGSMSMAFKPVSIMQSATDSLSAYLLITAAMALCMAVVALRIFRTLISQPLTAFQRIIGGSATSRKDDALHTRLTTHRSDELTDVIKAYDRLMDTIDSQRMALERQARVDPLTGLGNRLMLEERLNAAKTRARRHMGRGYILLIDLDNFKPINDVSATPQETSFCRTRPAAFGTSCGKRTLSSVWAATSSCSLLKPAPPKTTRMNLRKESVPPFPVRWNTKAGPWPWEPA